MMRIYIKHRYGGRSLISVEECCVAELRTIDFYLVNSEEELLEGQKNQKNIKLKVKKNYNSRTEQEKMDQLKSMKLDDQFGRDTDNNIRKIMALAQKWKFETGNRKLVVSSTGASLKHQLGKKKLS